MRNKGSSAWFLVILIPAVLLIRLLLLATSVEVPFEALNYRLIEFELSLDEWSLSYYLELIKFFFIGLLIEILVISLSLIPALWILVLVGYAVDHTKIRLPEIRSGFIRIKRVTKKKYNQLKNKSNQFNA